MSDSERPIAYYITAHGYGHGVRSCDIIRAFHRLYPSVPFVLVTDLPESFLRNRLADVPFTVRSAVFDVGMYQLDSVRVDVGRTLEEAAALSARREALVTDEMRYLRAQDVSLVVADIPSIPLEAAATVDIPCVAVGNFSWNWIYSAFINQDPRWGDVIRMFEEGYAQSDLLLRLPFAEEMKAFPRKCDIPVVAEPGTVRREDLAALTGAPPDRRWVLLSFSSLDWDEAALSRVEELDDYAFFTVRPLEWERKNIFPVDRERILFSDVMASVDIVVTKPGFGVLSECVVNRKPMVFVDRKDFLEYPVLERAVRRYLQHQHISAGKLYRGELKEALDRVLLKPMPADSPGMGGGALAARLLAERRNV